jgi:hypothetical protein
MRPRSDSKDFYVDLDGRLRKLETPAAASSANGTAATAADRHLSQTGGRQAGPPSEAPQEGPPAIRPPRPASTKRRSICFGPTSSKKRQRRSKPSPRTHPDSTLTPRTLITGSATLITPCVIVAARSRHSASSAASGRPTARRPMHCSTSPPANRNSATARMPGVRWKPCWPSIRTARRRAPPGNA